MARRRRAAQRPPEMVEKEIKARMVTPATGIPHTLAPIKLGHWIPGADTTATVLPVPEQGIAVPEIGNESPEGSNAARKLLFSAGSQVTPPIAATTPQDG
ncbi:hypothetical protein K7X08_002568 [Anisodus acutangulus]|uniref:Uncharacterized protein n=1 Tax=Anisodus acutangulus TaxID=402998 RepID=A0A9Q1LT57_9SOLA|nr:hypothetical protein K7X08_002568 [Anisodus acutangulus]